MILLKLYIKQHPDNFNKLIDKINSILFIYTRVCSKLQSLLIAIANRQGGEFPLAVFCCVKKHIRMYKLLNPDAVLIPRKPV
jgi:hypothetical protein